MTELVLVHKSTGLPVKIGEIVADFRNEPATITGWQEPKHTGSSGRVFVRDRGADYTHSYYPSVFNLEWSEINDATSSN